MSLIYRLARATSNTGDSAALQPRGVTCFVGGNNAGKSRLLRDIVTLTASHGPTEPAVLTGVEHDPPFPPTGLTEADLEEWLARHALRVNQIGDGTPLYTPNGFGMQPVPTRTMYQWLVHQPGLVTEIAPFFIRHSPPGANSGIAASSLTPDLTGHFGGNPLGAVFSDGALEEEFSNLCLQSFGFPLTFDRDTGDFRFRVGVPDAAPPDGRAPTREYSDALRRMDTLENQGDGVKSFLGIAVMLVTSIAQVHLIDEPETFLHPAQARALGRWIGERAHDTDRQVIVATHDRDFVLGLLEAERPVTFVRLVREGDRSSFYQLQAQEVGDIWGDSVLRYSNVLQGLFHSKVVICEADADCRFFRAVIDDVASEYAERFVADNMLLIPAGGKGRPATFAKALAKLGVETAVILDFDIFDNRTELIKIVEAVGANWTIEMNDLYVTMMRPVNQYSLMPSLKQTGLRGLPRGEVAAAGRALCEHLESIGVHVIPVGEMEAFDREIPEEKSAWVSAMLEKDGHRTCTEAREFASRVARFSTAGPPRSVAT